MVDTRDIPALSAYKFPDHYSDLLGMRVSAFDAAGREATVALTAEKKHLSPSGRVHGGVLAALLDSACGIAVCTTLTPAERCSTVEIKVNYFRPVNEGEELEAVAKVAFRGKKLCALIATLKRKGAEEPVAMATATFNIVEGGSA